MTELRKRGLLTAVICSSPFMNLGKAQARTFGVPELTFIEIPHPFGGLALEGVRGRAEIALPQLLSVIREQFK
jgi:hypothetical protein